jgi:murein tripeptide amidase MpaA
MPFDRYLRYGDLVEALRRLCDRHADLFRMQSLGRSHEGRDIWLVTATRFSTGSPDDKPALWIDGNIHATEVAGSMACLYFLEYLAEACGEDGEVTRCLDTRAFYMVPRLNPDGAEWALADRPIFVRSSTRPYPYDEAPVAGLRREDVDGDGRILTMRVPDPNGPWKVSTLDPRLLVRREPTEVGGQYFRLLPEGLIEGYDGVSIQLEPRRHRLDLNRNYPAGWRQEHEQAGAGPYPASEPEVRAAIAFITAHPNICAGIAFHTYSGVLLRPYSHEADDRMPPEDLWTYRKLGAEGTAVTGYPNVSAFHEFRYRPDEVITGTFDDWLYQHLGVFAWTVEIWSPQREAGITDYRFIDWYREHPPEDDLRLLRWNDTVLGGEGFVPWYRFEHPQLGPVELGGWDPLYTWSNPPPALLEREVARFPRWLVWHALVSPRLEVLEARAVPLGAGAYRVRLVVQNGGWLPSYVTKRALEGRLVRGVVCEIDLPEGVSLEAGQRRVEGGQLEGRAYTPAAPSSWAGWGGDVTSDRLSVEWIVRGAPGLRIGLEARHERAGRVGTAVTLP